LFLVSVVVAQRGGRADNFGRLYYRPQKLW
jgi:hypothetical protein